MLKFLLLLGGLLFVVARGVIYLLNKYSQNNLISKIKKNPAKASEYIPNLDIPIHKMGNSNIQSFDLIRSKIGSSPKIGSYSILHSMPVNDTQFLVFTQLSFTDFDVNITGRSGDVNKKAFHDFLFQFDSHKEELIMYSTLYTNATEKFQKEEFHKSLMSSY
jgi:hypothetical protein